MIKRSRGRAFQSLAVIEELFWKVTAMTSIKYLFIRMVQTGDALMCVTYIASYEQVISTTYSPFFAGQLDNRECRLVFKLSSSQLLQSIVFSETNLVLVSDEVCKNLSHNSTEGDINNNDCTKVCSYF